MSYTFDGVFIESPEQDIEELEKLFNGYARKITAPFMGVVISFKEADSEEENAQENEAPQLYDREKEHAKVRERILEKSEQLPQSNVAYIYYQTFGGQLDFVYGFACRSGTLLENSERCTEDEDEPDGNDIFLSLQESVGAKSPRAYFAPFERGYFPNTD